jgi:broad specificity phosphatase PhoE
MATFYILRHADKIWGNHYNPKLHHQDEPITPKGEAQAQKLVPYFADKEISRIYISAYQRTAQTIAPLADHLNLIPVVDERLNEIDNGVFDGMSEQEIQQKYPMELQAFQERKTDFRFPEGETGEEAQKRIVDFLEEKRKLHPDENTVAVCHEGLVRILMCHLTNNPVYNRWNFYVDFCGITELTYQPDFGKWKLMRFNQTCM